MAGQSLVLRRQTDLRVDSIISEFQSESEAITSAPYGVRTRAILYLLTAMVVITVVVLSVAKLDRVVSAGGRLVSRAPTLLVQPLDTSVLRYIHVHPGQPVAKGEILVTLDRTFSDADVAVLESKAIALAAEVERLRAEKDKTEFKVGPNATDQDRLQEAIFKYRMAELTSRLESYDQQLLAAEEHRILSARDMELFKGRLQVTTEIETMRADLERKEVGSRLNALIAKDARMEIQRNLATAEQQERTARFELETLKSEREAFLQQWYAGISQDFIAKETAFKQVAEELSKAKLRRDLVEIRAQEDATVVKVADMAGGAIVRGGEILVTLMPANAQLEVEVDLAGEDQGFVRIGDPVEIKLAAYSFMRHGTLKGVVSSISENSFDRLDNGQPTSGRYFKARIEIVDGNLSDVPDGFRLIAGMPLQAEIVVGSRTLLMYFADRIRRSGLEGFREP